MGREFIGEHPGSGRDPKLDDLEAELAIKYIKKACGEPPRGVDVQVTLEGCEVGNEGDEVSYLVISVVWDDSITEDPDQYWQVTTEEHGTGIILAGSEPRHHVPK